MFVNNPVLPPGCPRLQLSGVSTTHRVLELFVLLVVVLTATAANEKTLFDKCVDDLDCSLNGVCDTATGVCVCDPGWMGVPSIHQTTDCGLLDLLPAPSDVSFHGLSNKTSSWGGSVLLLPVPGGGGAVKDVWAMFAAEMTRGCTLQHWQTNSEVHVYTLVHCLLIRLRASRATEPHQHI